jgi:hypothetical protein
VAGGKPTTPPARDQNNRNSRLLPAAVPVQQQQAGGPVQQQQQAGGPVQQQQQAGGRKATDQLDELAKQLQDLVPSPGTISYFVKICFKLGWIWI